MTTTPVQERNAMPLTHEPVSSVDHNGRDYLTREEFMDELAKQLGEMYGLKDIREAV